VSEIKPNKFPGYILTKLSRDHIDPVYPMDFTYLANNYCAATLIPEISDPAYQVNVNVIIIIHKHHHFPNNLIGAKFL